MGERRRFGRTPVPSPRQEDRWMLETPEGVEVLARVRASICPESAIDVDAHAELVAVDVLRAKQTPRTAYGRPSLVLTRSVA